MKREIKIGFQDYTALVFIPDPASTDGSGKTGLVAANLTVSYTRVETDNDVTITDATSSLTNLSALTDAHSDWGLLEVSSTLAPGLYRLDIADAVFASGAWTAVVYVMITTSAAAASPMEFILVAFDPLDAVRLGLTALPNAAADGAGGLPISDAGGLDLDSKLANTNEITVARMGALTDWINGGRLDLILDDILLDTGTTLDDLVDDLESRLTAARAGYLDNLSAGAVALEATAQTILTDTNELQTDWVNGGRLDLIIDAIKAKTDQITFTTANKIDATIQVAGDFAQAAADKVWSTASRTLTAFGFSVTVGTNNDKTGYALSAAGIDAILDDAITEPAGVFAWGTATLRNIIAWIGALSSNEIRQTATLQTLRNRADNATIATAAVSDDGTTAVRDSFT